MTGTILDVSGLEVSFDIGGEPAVAVDRLGFSLRAGETLGIVGESGSGKSMAALAVMGLIPSPPGSVSGGSIRFRGRELVGMDEEERRRIRGKDIAMIFQEPMTALNPVFTVGDQIAETLMLHEGLERRAAWEKAAELLAEVGIPEPAIRVRNYPFELSGGMRQRAAFARTMLTGSDLLLLDEPFSALDFLTRISMQEWLLDQWRRHHKTILFITHDVESIATMADRVIVMYAGRCVESGTAEDILLDPRHPYTQGLIACIPHLCRDGGKRSAPLQEIPGMVPSIRDIGPGCAFAPRCALAKPDCFAERPPFTTSGGRGTACFRAAPSERSLP